MPLVVSAARMRISLAFLRVLSAAVLFAGTTVLAQSQVPGPAKHWHTPRTLPRTKFYDTPTPLRAGKPGELIRSEPFDDYDLPYQISAVRILYHSRSPRGEDVAVSGVVLVPAGTPPARGWPVIAWAHDFIGSAGQCAPSLRRNLKDGLLLSMYVGAGYAVVASDYAGLGTSLPSAALDMRSNALDVIYSIPAARAALPQLGTKWVAAGYSQGGLVVVASWFGNLREAQAEVIPSAHLVSCDSVRDELNVVSAPGLVLRGIVDTIVSDVKTEYSRAGMPLDPALADVLLHWQRTN